MYSEARYDDSAYYDAIESIRQEEQEYKEREREAEADRTEANED